MPDNSVTVKVALSPELTAILEVLFTERKDLRSALRTLIDEAERVILAEEQATGRALASLQWAVDRAHTALANTGDNIR